MQCKTRQVQNSVRDIPPGNYVVVLMIRSVIVVLSVQV